MKIQCPNCKIDGVIDHVHNNIFQCYYCETQYNLEAIRQDSGDGTYTEVSLIDYAVDITSGDRRRDYGRPLINHLRIALEWSNYLGHTITPDKVVWMMIGLKKAREAHTTKYDNLVDTVGYGLCLDDMYVQFIELGYGKNRDEAMARMQSMTRAEMTKLLEELEQ